MPSGRHLPQRNYADLRYQRLERYKFRDVAPEVKCKERKDVVKTSVRGMGAHCYSGRKEIGKVCSNRDLMLTSRDAEDDRVEALEAGADD